MKITYTSNELSEVYSLSLKVLRGMGNHETADQVEAMSFEQVVRLNGPMARIDEDGNITIDIPEKTALRMIRVYSKYLQTIVHLVTMVKSVVGLFKSSFTTLGSDMKAAMNGESAAKNP